MVHRSRLAALRAQTFVDQVVGPAADRARRPIEVEHLSDPAVMDAETAGASDAWRPFALGDVFGPPWSRHWFRLRGELPDSAGSALPWLHFAVGTEGLLRRADGSPWHGLDPNHAQVELDASLMNDGRVELLVEVDCNRPLGATTFFFDAPEDVARWSGPKPGRLDAAALFVRDARAWRLAQALRAAAELVESLGAGSARGNQLARALEDARLPIERVLPATEDGGLPADALEAALCVIEPALANGAAPSASRCFPVGHAHLDTAWLWDTPTTRRKLVRTASTALRTLAARPSFRFVCSQPQQYAWLEGDEPALFEEVKSAVFGGRWEPLGATWIEPDGNLPSGESFCRQFEEGLRYTSSRFGPRGEQRLLFLPDSFGFAGSLPQLAVLAGLDTFVTNKLWWSETTEFPHATFRWRGIDGTEILSHLTPGQDYNATLHVEDLRRGERILAERDECGATSWLQPYGWGDGGGGPTQEQAVRVELLENAEELPRLDPGGTRAFCEALHDDAQATARAGRPIPRHDGELYLELHRGTWTSQAALKRANATLECALRREEALAVLAGDAERSGRARAMWRELLLNQFHDILPGSGTREVVEEALERYAVVERGLAEAAGSGAREVRFNPLSRTDDGLAPLGIGAHSNDGAGPATRDELRLENEHLVVELDDQGRVVALARKNSDAPAMGSRERPLLDPRLHHDRPRRWEAWDVDEEDLLRWTSLAGARSTLEPDGPYGFRATHRSEGGSELELHIALPPGAQQLEVDLRVRWCEDRRLLRLAFPTGARSSRWTASVPFGHVERATTRNTPGERARFETPIHRWIDLSEPGRGLSVLSDACYGGACLDDTLALSLLRATRFPDAVGDSAEGGSEHRFRLALAPHGGDWRHAPTLDLAESIALPDLPLRSDADDGGLFGLEQQGAGRAQVSGLRHAHEGDEGARDDRVQLRLFESHGAHATTEIRWRAAPGALRAVDLRGEPDPRVQLEHAGDHTHLRLAPFQVATLEVARTS